MDVKSKAGGDATILSYKKSIVPFDEGTPQEWISTRKDIMKVWTQDNIISAIDQVAIVRAALRKGPLTTFDSALNNARKADDGSQSTLTMDMITQALAKVTESIFSHHALEIQKQWMQKVTIKKPSYLSSRNTTEILKEKDISFK